MQTSSLIDPAAEVMTVGETARALRLSEKSVYALVRSGDLPSIRVGAGRRIRIPTAAVRALLDGAGSGGGKP